MWPPEAIEFLRELEDNNDRDWFRANRARYDELLLGPAHRVADTLDRFGKPHYFRPYNNLRFRPGPPLKEHIGVAIGYGGAGGYYFELSLDGFLVAAGLHRPATDQLERFRAAINDGRRAKAFERIVTVAQDGGLELTAPAIKRAPRGYRPDHPRIDRLRLKSLVVSRRHALGSWLHQPTCGKRIRSEFAAAAPFVTWIGEAVGPSHGSRS
jgi:uncharacterized protein (TIGR02453 family)